MTPLSDDQLNQLLKGAYPAVEVSPDFTLRLWRRLMKSPRPPWMVPVPAAILAAALGVFFGIQSWVGVIQPQRGLPAFGALAAAERLDLFGNAPSDSLAGSYLNLLSEG